MHTHKSVLKEPTTHLSNEAIWQDFMEKNEERVRPGCGVSSPLHVQGPPALTKKQRRILFIIEECHQCSMPPSLKTISNCLRDNPTTEEVDITVKELTQLGFVDPKREGKRIMLV